MGAAQLAETALFKTWKGALAFAYNFTHGTMKPSAMAGLMGGARQPGRGLGGLDGAAQAGMILAEVSQLPHPRRHILTCRFAPAKTDCECRAACCQGFRLNRDWADSMQWLANHVHAAALTGTVSNYHLRRDLVRRYFGETVSMTETAARCGVKRDTAAEHNKRVVAYLAAEEHGAEQDIYGRLYGIGICES